MIRVRPQPEPADFDRQVRQPGRAAQAQGRLPTLWQGQCLRDLNHAYSGICAYLGVFIHPGTATPTVDHYHPKSAFPALAYEWSNYRLASARVNGHKRDFQDVLDPFTVEDGWFTLEVFTFEVQPAPNLDPTRRQQVQATIHRLKLNCAEFKTARAHGFDAWHLGHISWALLEAAYPFVARELRRQGLSPQSEG